MGAGGGKEGRAGNSCLWPFKQRWPLQPRIQSGGERREEGGGRGGGRGKEEGREEARWWWHLLCVIGCGSRCLLSALLQSLLPPKVLQPPLNAMSCCRRAAHYSTPVAYTGIVYTTSLYVGTHLLSPVKQSAHLDYAHVPV